MPTDISFENENNDEALDNKKLYERYKHEDPKLIQNLRSIGIGEGLAIRVIQYFGIKHVYDKIFRQNPYSLMDVDGFGFIRTDRIGKMLGITTDDPRRITALIISILETNKNFGHVYLPTTILEKECKKQNISKHLNLIDKMIKENVLILDGANRLYTRKMFLAETKLSEYLLERTEIVPEYPHKSMDTENCDPDQSNVLNNFQKYNIFILTGSPGSGKTYTIGKICSLLPYNIALCAPTGKAAKRMKDLSGRPAKTIHRLLGGGFGHWKFHAGNQLHYYSHILVDEVSMLDVELAWRLFSAIPPDTCIYLIGDKDQLCSVGPGSVLRDTISSQKIHTYFLTHNHRQGKGSLITHNAQLINKGVLKLTFDDDLQFIEADNPIEIREKLPRLIEELKSDGYDLIEDIQVLSPQHSTPVGVTQLNDMLRFLINPHSKPSEKFSIGDKVMQTTNDYDLNVFNGYLGIIEDITNYFYMIRFFDAEDSSTVVKYPRESSNNLMLAYCCTIHKYQGSEAKAGVIILSNSHTFMWNRSLIYTAITRFKEKCYILGDASTFRKAIVTNTEQTRYSKLFDRLTGRI